MGWSDREGWWQAGASGGGIFVGADLVFLSPGVTLVALNTAYALNPKP